MAPSTVEFPICDPSIYCYDDPASKDAARHGAYTLITSSSLSHDSCPFLPGCYYGSNRFARLVGCLASFNDELSRSIGRLQAVFQPIK
jgi:hypothetical protein